MIRAALLLVLLAGCAGLDKRTPLWGPDVAHLCVDGEHTYTHEGQTNTFIVHLLDPMEVQVICGGPMACVFSGRDIYVPNGRDCGKRLAHEMSHVWGYHFVDLVRVSSGG